MLSFLRVENLAVVEKTELDFSPGFNVLTGETGAGKSILIDALQLLTARRIAPGLIRSGKEKLVVEALFSQGEEELTLKREVNAHKSVCFLNGQVVPFEQLKERAVSLINVYGQRDHAFLLNSANQLLFLDQFALNHDVLTLLAQKAQALKELLHELADLEKRNSDIKEKVAYIDYQLQELEGLNLQKGEDHLLEERRKVLFSAETIRTHAQQLLQDLHQKDNSVYGLLAQNRQSTEYLAGLFPEFVPFKEKMDEFANLVGEISDFLHALIQRLEYSEDELNGIQEKLDKLSRMKAKTGMNLEQLLDKAAEWQEERDRLLAIPLSIQDKKEEGERTLAEYSAIQLQLRQRREKGAEKLSNLVEKELAHLEMKKAKFEARFTEIEPRLDNVSERGTDRMEFFFTSNPGQPAGPLSEVASGGELSRLMLVFKSISAQEKDVTFIFDEIDAGIGGKTAEFVGDKLRKISQQNQVICISHLPQIASFADRHFLISKEFKDNQTFSSARELQSAERHQEIARLMAGSAINADVLKAAERLLEKNR